MTPLKWRNLTVLLALAAVLLLPSAVNADTVPLSGYLTSNPSDNYGIIASDGWSIVPWFKVAWNITDPDPNDGLLHYQYIITNGSDGDLSRDLSHFILQVSTGTTAADFLNALPAYDSGDPKYYSSADPSNPNMPNPIYGLKFNLNDAATAIIEFDSTRLPVLGSFYAKDGVFNPGGIEVTAWNTGLEGGTAFIVVPDTKIPVPPTALLLGSGLLGLGLVGIRKRK
ncbi:MAG: hypothetical protein HY790_01420 [Deltaproteobacteria bacterium]|nr:hypothetical protein [Deltaproteobacteria bacterium]